LPNLIKKTRQFHIKRCETFNQHSLDLHISKGGKMNSWKTMIIASSLGLEDIDHQTDYSEQECVILLHGLARTPSSMRILEWSLKNAGYRVINIGYPSRQATIAKLSEDVLSRAVDMCGNTSKIHIVTHSLGGIILRQWSIKHRLLNAGRAVMLGPPNGGSELVDAFKDWPVFETIHGPAGKQLGKKSGSLISDLPVCSDFDLGIIAGSRSINPLASAFISGPNDGKVSVSSAFSIAARDKLVLPVSHTWMTIHPKVVEQVERFIKQGSFSKVDEKNCNIDELNQRNDTR
jgi:triacylglycerol lipase